ncbi:MAG: MgtC/SapB family protein [Oscillospiraceae bacterium]|nr:MgtC/SapB family protein [Oscillospiraceae bacterium]
MELREVTYLAVAVRIVAAVIIGGLLGLERGMKNRPAGLRTYMLVCVGACLIMLTNQYIYQVFGTGDPVRMGAQVVSGIGFLGAGTIVVTRRNQIKGLTTAAGLWTAAGVGLALGIGFYEAALVGGLAMFFVITVLQRMDNNMHRKSRQMEVYIELSNTVALGDFLRAVREKELEIYNVQREQESDSDAGNRAYIATVKSKKRSNHLEVLEQVQTVPGVAYLEEL